MRIADLRTPSTNLNEAYEQLEMAWANLKEVWGDSAMQAFEDNYLSQIRPRVRMTLDAAGRLSTVFDEAQRKCQAPKEDYQ